MNGKAADTFLAVAALFSTTRVRTSTHSIRDPTRCADGNRLPNPVQNVEGGIRSLRGWCDFRPVTYCTGRSGMAWRKKLQGLPGSMWAGSCLYTTCTNKFLELLASLDQQVLGTACLIGLWLCCLDHTCAELMWCPSPCW